MKMTDKSFDEICEEFEHLWVAYVHDIEEAVNSDQKKWETVLFGRFKKKTGYKDAKLFYVMAHLDFEQSMRIIK